MSLKIRKAVIPVAGLGTRFLPVSKVVPKELLPIGDKPVIHYVVEEAVKAGIEEIVLVCHSGRDQVLRYFQPDPALSAHLGKRGLSAQADELRRIERCATFRVVYQDVPKGLGHAIGCARDVIGSQPFLVLLPDVLVFPCESGASSLVEACGEADRWGLLLERVSRERIPAYGIVACRGREKGSCDILGAVEKPAPEEAPSDLAIVGRYVLGPEIFEEIDKSVPGTLGEIQLTDAVNRLCTKTPGLGLVCDAAIFDVGTPPGLHQATRYLLDSRAETRP